MLPHIWKEAYKECFAGATQLCSYLQFTGRFLSSYSQEFLCSLCSQRQQLGGTNPFLHSQCQDLFLVRSLLLLLCSALALSSSVFFSFLYVFLAVCFLDYVNYHLCLVVTSLMYLNLAKCSRHSCGVRRLSVFKHVCPLTCFCARCPSVLALNGVSVFTFLFQ